MASGRIDQLTIGRNHSIQLVGTSKYIEGFFFIVSIH